MTLFVCISTAEWGWEMKLFRFEKFSKDEKFRLDAIKNKKIFFSAPKKFNDLRDCELDKIFYYEYGQLTFDRIKETVGLLKHNESHPIYKKVLNFFNHLDPSCRDQNISGLMSALEFCNIKEFILYKIGVCCFSEEISDLMWGYYGDSHRGYCVEYEVDLEKAKNIKKVVYSTERENVFLDELLFNPEKTILRVIATKNIQWLHEKEWRVYDISGNVFDKAMPLPDGITPVRIITGEKFCREDKSLLVELGLDVIAYEKYKNGLRA